MNDPQKDETVADVEKLYQAGADIEMLVFFMRERGLNQFDSLKALLKITPLSMKEAKSAIDESKTWSEYYSSNVDLRDSAWQALLKLSEEKSIDLPRISIKVISKSEPRE